MRLVLMGTGPFAVPSFEALRGSDHDIELVVTRPEPPVKSRKGPPPAPVRTWAESHSLPIFDPSSINDVSAIERLNEINADLLVVCDYGQILKPDALACGRLGGINLHGSLLPAYRGAAPVQRSLLNGDDVTGVTVIHMTPRLDAGPVLGQADTAIRDDETAGELEERLSQLGVALTMECVDRLSKWDGESDIGELQDKSAASKAPRLSKQEARIDYSQSFRHIDCHVRGMQPWPVAFSELTVREGKPPVRLSVLKVSRIETDQDVSDLAPGSILGGGDLQVRIGDGVLRIEQLKPAGKREMSGEDFMRGHQLARGTRLT